MKKLTKLTENVASEFLEELAKGEPIIRACAKFGLSRQAVYKRRAQSKKFAECWDQAVEDGRQAKVADLEEEADRRAMTGTLEPVYYKGKACGAKRRFSDTLLITRLKALEPDRYGDKTKIDYSEEIKTPPALVVPGPMVPDEWADAAKEMKGLGPPPMPDDE
jgi:hypothetical protein